MGTKRRNTDVDVRRASEADIGDLVALYSENHRFQTDLVPERLSEPSTEWTSAGLARELLVMLQRSEQAIFVAISDGVVIGLVDVLVVDPVAEGAVRRRHARVDNLVVSAGRRSGGVGNRLMEAAEEWAGHQDAFQLEVKIWDRPGGPLSFYERRGYVTLSRLMTKSLR